MYKAITSSRKERPMKHIGHGNREIVERLMPSSEAKSRIKGLKRLEVSGRCVRECIDISYGFFTPLTGFLCRSDVESVCDKMTLTDGTLWPITILLDVNEEEIREKNISVGETILLIYSDTPLAIILVNCIIGPKRIGDYIDEAIVVYHDELRTSGYFRDDIHMVSITLWDMRYAGPKEAVFHAIIRTNLGCTHHMFGRDHAGVGSYYDPYDAHRIFDQFSEAQLNIKPVRVLEWWYCPVCGEVTYSGLCGHSKKNRASAALSSGAC